MKDSCYDYLPEALAELAYLSFLSGDFAGAVQFGNDAFWRYHVIGAVDAMRSSREIVVASLMELGEVDRAERIADLAENDILGCGGMHDA